MTVWELAVHVDGRNAANGAEPQAEPLTAEEFEAVLDRNRDFLES